MPPARSSPAPYVHVRALGDRRGEPIPSRNPRMVASNRRTSICYSAMNVAEIDPDARPPAPAAVTAMLIPLAVPDATVGICSPFSP